ncbi:MAG: tetratricopeptide repeat protein [Candidatus Hodarchaeota archaeon]
MPPTKLLVYKKEYIEGVPTPDFNVNQIGEILININLIPHFLDYELVDHSVNFRNVKEGSREDIIFHYVDILPIFRKPKEGERYAQINEYRYRDTITKIDIVSFFTNSKEGKFEHRIYQIGRIYVADELSLNDLFGLGELNYDINDYDKAITFYTKALEYEPEDCNILTNLGLAYMCKLEYGKAIQLYKRALEIESEDPLIWDDLGIAYEYNKEYEKAKEAYQRALELDPNDPEIKEHIEEIKNKIS